MALRLGTLLLSPIRIQDDTIPAPVAYINEIQGGLHSAATLAERDAVPAYYRQWGMRFKVYNDGGNTGLYELTYGNADTVITNNANWVNVTVLNQDTPVEQVIATGATMPYTLTQGYLLDTILIKGDVDLPAAGAETADSPGSSNIINPEAVPTAKGAVWLVNLMAWTDVLDITITGLSAGVKVYFMVKKIVTI